MGKDRKWFEDTHDYIQWLFPLYTRSQFNPQAPELSDEVREVFISSSHEDHALIQINFRKSIDSVIKFFGFWPGIDPDKTTVTEVLFREFGQYCEDNRPDVWPFHFHPWLRKGNHNQLRITRVLRSMTLLGRHELAVSFHKELLDLASSEKIDIEAQTRKFWDDAIIPVKGIF